MGNGSKSLNLLPYFEPLFPAVTYTCQLCGKTLSRDTMLTQPARTRGMGGDYIFCQECSPHLERITQRLGAEAAKMDAEYAKMREDRLQELAREWLEELKAGGAASPPHEVAAHAAPTIGTPLARRRPLSITVPDR